MFSARQSASTVSPHVERVFQHAEGGSRNDVGGTTAIQPWAHCEAVQCRSEGLDQLRPGCAAVLTMPVASTRSVEVSS